MRLFTLRRSIQRQLREKLPEAARRREIDVVLVRRLDRWGRSVTDLLATMLELEHLGVGFVSLTGALDLHFARVKVSPAIEYEGTWSRTGNQQHSLHLSPLEPALEAQACAG